MAFFLHRFQLFVPSVDNSTLTWAVIVIVFGLTKTRKLDHQITQKQSEIDRFWYQRGALESMGVGVGSSELYEQYMAIYEGISSGLITIAVNSCCYRPISLWWMMDESKQWSNGQMRVESWVPGRSWWTIDWDHCPIPLLTFNPKIISRMRVTWQWACHL